MGLIDKHIPEKIKKALEDQDVVRDLDIILKAMQKALTATAQDPATDSSLRTAFNDTVILLDAADTYATKGKIPLMTMAKLAKDVNRWKVAGRTMASEFNAESMNPATQKVLDSLLNNTEVQDAFVRISLKTGDLFELEKSPNGQCYGVELVSPNRMKLPITEEVYNKVKAALDSKNPPPPAPPAGPNV